MSDSGRSRPGASDIPKHYVIVRKDLPIGLMAASIVHAAGESACITPPTPDTHAVVLVIDSDADLLRLADKLARHGIRARSIYEDTEPFVNQLVAVGVDPGAREAGRWLAHLPTLKACSGSSAR